MNYILSVCTGTSSDERDIINPSPEVIERAIDELIPAENRYVILESDVPVDDCVYIQTLMPRKHNTDLEYLVELRFIHGDDFKQYAMHTTDVAKLKRMFRMFALGIVPKIADWVDITDNLLADIQRTKDLMNGQSV